MSQVSALDSRQLSFALAVHYAAMVSLAIAVNFTPVFLTTIGKDLGGLTNGELGRISGVTFLGLVVGIIGSGPLADRIGARFFAMAGNGLVAGGLVALGLSRGYGGLLGAVFVMGMGAGVLDVVLSPMVSALQPANRTAAMNRLHSFYSIGAVGTVLGGTFALRWGIGWRELALGMALAPAAVVVVFGRLRVPAMTASGEATTSLRVLFGRSFFVLALLLIFLGCAMEIGLTAWMAAYVEETLGFSKFISGAALVGFCVAMAVGRLAGGKLAGKFSAMALLLVGCWVSLALLLVICFSPWGGMALAGCVVIGLSVSTFWPSILGMAGDRFPQGGARLFGLLAALGNTGGMVWPLVIGKIADHGTMRMALASAGVCPVVMVGCLLRMRRCGEGTKARGHEGTEGGRN